MKGPLKKAEQVDSCIKSGSKEFNSFRFNIKDSSDPQNGPFWALANFSRATDLLGHNKPALSHEDQSRFFAKISMAFFPPRRPLIQAVSQKRAMCYHKRRGHKGGGGGSPD